MKKIIHSFLMVLFIGLLIFGCERKEDNNATQLILTGKMVSNTICKNQLKSSSQIVATPDSLSCVEYSFDSNEHKLNLKHINAGFNCCPDSLYCKIELKNDTILIYEFEKSAHCRCNCLYDLDIEINGVNLKKYQIKLIEPYIGKQSKHEFEIDLSKNSSGTNCVKRTQYPWGINSF